MKRLAESGLLWRVLLRWKIVIAFLLTFTGDQSYVSDFGARLGYAAGAWFFLWYFQCRYRMANG